MKADQAKSIEHANFKNVHYKSSFYKTNYNLSQNVT